MTALEQPVAPESVTYGLYDADEHYYEPDDCFSRHIESGLRDRTIRVERGADGLGSRNVAGHYYQSRQCDPEDHATYHSDGGGRIGRLQL